MLVKYEAKDGQLVSLGFDTIKRYLIQGNPSAVTEQEMVFFMGMCQARGLNPFNKDCYLMKYSANDNAAIVVSIDHKRKRARVQDDCRGWTKGIIVQRKIEGEHRILYSNGLMLPGDELLGGWFRAKPAGWDEPYQHEVNLSGYIKRTKNGEITKFWKPENQPTMIAKVAESQGLSVLWPDDLGKLYTPEEVQQEEGSPKVEIEAGEEEKPKGLEMYSTEQASNDPTETKERAKEADPPPPPPPEDPATLNGGMGPLVECPDLDPGNFLKPDDCLGQCDEDKRLECKAYNSYLETFTENKLKEVDN